MPGLLTPAFLVGLAALAVPLLVHLIRRERQDAVEFPSLMFISRIPQRTVQRRRIRNWWLFALRCLALILLVGAFARPFVERSADVVAAGAAREVVILLDRSYSMGYADRWDRARAAAREAINALGPADRAALVVFDATANTLVMPTGDAARLRAALDGATVGAGVTRYTPALKVAQSILGASELTRLEAVLISDFQRSGWDGAAGAQLPAGAELRTVVIGSEAVENLVVSGLTLDRARDGTRERVSVLAHVANRGQEHARAVPITLEVDGRRVQSERLDVPASGTASMPFQPLAPVGRPMRVTARAGTDALPIDNAFHAVLAAENALRVLIVEAAGRDASLYIRPALELAHAPPIEVRTKRDGLPTPGELARADVVLLNDVAAQGEAGRRLLEWVTAGGGVVIALGERSAGAQWGEEARALAGGTPDRVADRVEGGGARLGYLDYSHPVLEPFRAPRAGSFSGLRFYRYRTLPADAAAQTDSSAAATQVLARFDDGGAALVERRVGAGRVLVWGSTLDALWTNAPLEPVFLPLVQQLVRYAAGFTPPAEWNTIGQVVDVGGGASQALLVGTPGGARLEVAAGSPLVTLEEPGFYEVREARAGAGVARVHAANVDVTESDFAALDPAEIVRAVSGASSMRAAAAASPLPREEYERRQSLWWYLLFTAFALLTAEAVLAGRRSRRAA
jgi:hypothetical protein